MKLYRTQSLNTETERPMFTWQGTQADASAKRAKLKKDGFTEIETKDIDVPTDKAGLLEFLNKNCTGE